MGINDTVLWKFSGHCKVRICTPELSARLLSQLCTTPSSPEPLAWGLPRGSIPPKMSVSEVFDGREGGLLPCRVALGTFILHTQLHMSIFNPLRQLQAACVAMPRLDSLESASLLQSHQQLWGPF